MNRVFQSHIAMLGFSILIAGSFSLGSMVANDISPIALTAVRFVLAAFIVGSIALFSGSIARKELTASWRYFVLGGTFSLYFILMFEGLKTASPVSAVAVFTLIPAMSCWLGFVILGQMVSGRTLLAVVIGATGSLWVVFRADFLALTMSSVGRGELIYFVGCVAHAFMPILFRGLNRGENPVMVTFGLLVSGALILCLFGAGEIIQTDWKGLPGLVWITIFYVAVFATAVTSVCLQFASMHLPAANVMAYTYLTPTWVLLWEILLGHDMPPFWIWGGVLLTAVSVIVLLRASLKN
ncbi:DMT family transporter [uncultured Planktomarina sp.]|jgi:drug/metabolite transporter (DMT)-like permease|uniref:DMT family transporter n=1 Tax=uncultured Planktomarina sp. TaxID=1538529 RepID=UPI00326178FD